MSYPYYERARALLSEHTPAETIQSWLRPVGVTDWRAAHRGLLRIAADAQDSAALSALLPALLMALADAANADHVLVNLERFIRSAADKSGTLHYLAQNPRAVEILVKLFAGSQFLTEILLRNPEYFPPLIAHKRLTQPKSVAQLCADLYAAAEEQSADGVAAQWDALRRFQRGELLRIGAGDLLGLCDLPAVTLQLSHLADSLAQVCLELAAQQTGQSPAGFVVLAMGKLGGGELNYSSDIDLLFLARQDAGAYQRLGERFIEALTRVTSEGFLYRVDMRLRPWGQVGPLITSLPGYLKYLDRNARLWEKQALLKARPIAGDIALGVECLQQIAPFIYADTHEPGQAAAIRDGARAMKQRTEDQLHQEGRAWGEVKLGEGSIRDAEFVVQSLQMIHGGACRDLHGGNTLDVLPRLAARGLLAGEDEQTLATGYVFLRTVEHHLQMLHYRQTHTLPDDAVALDHLARRLGFAGPDAREQFLARYEQHRRAIRRVYLHYLGDETMENPSRPRSPQPLKGDLSTHIARMAPSYAETFTPDEIRRHAVLAGQLNAAQQVEIEAAPLDNGGWRLTVVAYDYLGELSLICGLIFVYGCTIADGNVFTYEPADPAQRQDARRKIVDVFTVLPEHKAVTADTWQQYHADLAHLLALMNEGQRREARGLLAKRWADTLRETPTVAAPLYPIEIQIDNEADPAYTVLHIDALDTSGFLYEFTNALAYQRVYIARMTVDSAGARVHDVLYVTDANGHKITSPEKLHQLRVASVLTKHFTHLLPQSPNPETALLHFREFIGQRFQRDDWTDELASLERPEVLNALARLLGVSDFLWEDFLRMQYANLFPVVRDVDALHTMKSRAQLQAELEAELRPVHDGPQPLSEDAPWRKTLNAFKDREMFRIDMRHILGHTQEFDEFSEELTALAEVVVNAVYHLCHEDLRAVYGDPCLENGDVSDMTVCALGKCGGYELGFASDIELLFIYSGNGWTTGPTIITTAEFYEKVVQAFVAAIQAKREGIFEIDLQLRPYGKAGSMAVSLDSFQRYFAPEGPAWAYERQALVKLRPIAGNVELGQAITSLRDQFVYTGEPFDATAMRAMRERQIRHLVTGGTFNAKYSPGGLVDLEYVVQGLQIAHGATLPALRQTNTRAALATLAEAGILNEADYTRLRKAHTFLRWLIDGLRMVRGNNKDLSTPPPDSEAFAFLARRLRYGDDVARLRDELTMYSRSVQEISGRLL
ncbi:MAG TPA: glutamine synthetase adenylyltransferase [Anaerolineae bacterium]|nr:glutamine synthetase adenylyltransferase [Anaerolineae bacterium]